MISLGTVNTLLGPGTGQSAWASEPSAPGCTTRTKALNVPEFSVFTLFCITHPRGPSGSAPQPPGDPHLGDADASESLHTLWQAAQDVQDFPGHFGCPHGPTSTGHQRDLFGRGQGTADLLCHLVSETPTQRLKPITPLLKCLTYPGFLKTSILLIILPHFGHCL